LTKARRKTAVSEQEQHALEIDEPEQAQSGGDRVVDDRAGRVAQRSGQQNPRMQRSQDDERPAAASRSALDTHREQAAANR
jgi:hypothetical protein